MTTPDHPTPAQVLEQFEASLNPLEYADDTATHYSVPIEIADAALATLRQQAEALAQAEAREARLRETLHWYGYLAPSMFKDDQGGKARQLLNALTLTQEAPQ